MLLNEDLSLEDLLKGVDEDECTKARRTKLQKKLDMVRTPATKTEEKEEEEKKQAKEKRKQAEEEKKRKQTAEEEELGAWQVLAELRDHTGFAKWRQNKEGWGALEEHRDPSQCTGVTMESGEITEIDLSCSNLSGKVNIFGTSPVMTQVTLRLLFRSDS